MMRRGLVHALFLAVFVAALIAHPVQAATDVGLYQRAACTQIASPVADKTYCLQSSDGNLYKWSGTAWVLLSPGGPLPGYTKAGLPTAGQAGRLARVTDDIGGVWMDTGLTNPGWVNLRGGAVLVTDPAIGAKCDGATDDSTAFTTAVTRLPSIGGTIILPPGTCLVKNWTISKNHVRVVGQGFSWAAAGSPTMLRPPNGVLATDDTIRSPIGTFGLVLEYLAVSADAPNGTDFARTAVSAAGEPKLHHVLLQGGVAYSFDTVVSGTPADSADSGGIFDSVIYGSVRIKASNFLFRRNYMNGGGAGTAITLEGKDVSASSTEIWIVANTIESYGTPVIKINTAGLAAVQQVAIENNRIQSSAGTGALISQLDASVKGLSIRGNRIRSAGGTPTRAIDLSNVSAADISGNTFWFITEWSAGTKAPINLTTLGGSISIDQNGGDGGDVEHAGYRSHSLISSGGSLGTAHSVVRRGVLVTTTNATPTTLFAVATDASEILSLKARVLSDNTVAGTLNVNDYERMATFRRRAAGAPAQVGTTTSIHTAEDDAGADVGILISGNDAIVQVTGIAATTFNWKADVEYLRK